MFLASETQLPLISSKFEKHSSVTSYSKRKPMTTEKIQRLFLIYRLAQEMLYIIIKCDWLPRKVTQIDPASRPYMVTTLTGAGYRHNMRQLKALCYTSSPTTSPFPRPSTWKKGSALCCTKMRARFNWTTKEITEWHIINSEKPPRNQATLPNKSLPTMAEDPQPAPAIHLSLTPNIPTLHVLIEPLDSFQSTF